VSAVTAQAGYPGTGSNPLKGDLPYAMTGIPATFCAPSAVSSALNNYLLLQYPSHMRKMPAVAAQDAR